MKIIDYPVNHYSKGRPYGIKNIIVHHMAGNLSAQRCAQVLNNRGVSAHYGVGNDGVVGRYVAEGNRAWHAGDGIGRGSKGNDKGIGIEVANSALGGNWPVSNASKDLLVELCYDIARRNGMLPLKRGVNLFGHRDCQATTCPGNDLYGWLDELARRVNAKSVSPAPAPRPAPAPQPQPPKPAPKKDSMLPARGYWRLGDNDSRVGKIASFMYRNFPAYTKRAALGNYYGPNIKKSILEFQRRTGMAKVDCDGNVGPKTLAMLRRYGFKN